MDEAEGHPKAGIENNILTVAFNRPEKMNAMRRADFLRLLQFVERFRDDDDLKALVLTGTGRAFCAGEDLNEAGKDFEQNPESIHDAVVVLQQITRTLYEVDKPTIAAINGAAVGFGVEISLSCDVSIAAEEAYFWLSETERGLLHTNGTFHLLPRIVGFGNARAMIVGGQKVSAERALAIGLVAHVVPGSELPAAAAELAEKLRGYSTSSLSIVKKLLRESHRLSLHDSLDAELAASVELMGSGDTLERLAAFTDREA